MNKKQKWARAGRILFPLVMLWLLQVPAAAGIADSTLGIGLKNMISDAFTYLIFICPSVAAICVAVFAIRKSMADEQDGKMWKHRMVNAVIYGVLGTLGSLLIALVTSYFK